MGGGKHVARPARRVALRVLGGELRITWTQVSLLRSFGADGQFADNDPHLDVRIMNGLIRKGWVQRTHGTFVLTGDGLKVKGALDAYLQRKQDYLSKGNRS